MRLTAIPQGDPQDLIERDILAGEGAVTRAMRSAGQTLKANWRGQVRGAGLGSRLANTVRGEAYPKGSTSLNAAALVWTKAPEIIAGFEDGITIQSKDGFYLAIPTQAAGRGPRGARMTPLTWERRHGMRLRFVYRRTGPSLLVADDARLTKKGSAIQKRGKRRKRDGILTGAQTVPIFILVPKVRIGKRLNLLSAAERVSAQIPGLIASNWK